MYYNMFNAGEGFTWTGGFRPESKRTHKMKATLDIAWDKRAKLRAEGNKLRAEGSKLHTEGDKLRAEGSKLYAEGNKLHAEGSKLRAEGDLVFVNEVIRLCGGDALMEWPDDGGCIVMGVMEFQPQK